MTIIRAILRTIGVFTALGSIAVLALSWRLVLSATNVLEATDKDMQAVYLVLVAIAMLLFGTFCFVATQRGAKE